MLVRERAWRGAPTRGVALALFASALAHLALYALLRWTSMMPSVDFELALPSEVEFGLTEQAAVAIPVPPPPAAVEAPSAATPAVTPGSEKPKHKPKREPVDAGVPDAGEQAPNGQVAQAGEPRSDAGVPGGDGQPLLAAFAPKGAQIALRVHMGRVRVSELAEDVRGLLDAVPDWRLVLGGSGIDPLRDLERLYLATPDLRRSHLVIAGEYVGSAELPRQAVASLAEARGQEARWSKRGGIAVAPWFNEDETERVVALIAPHQFAITRPDDLQRVLLVARALAARAHEAKKPRDDATDNGDALLALGEHESFALSVEGARLFARGNTRGVPERLELAVSLAEDGAYTVHATGYFESADAAEQARDYWQSVRDRFATNPLVALIGMREPLTSMELSANEAPPRSASAVPPSSQLVLTTRVSVPQARVLLGFLRQALDRGQPARDRALGGTRTQPLPSDRRPLSPPSP